MHVYIYYVRIHIYHVYFRVCNIEKQQRTRRKKKKKKKGEKKHLYLILWSIYDSSIYDSFEKYNVLGLIPTWLRVTRKILVLDRPCILDRVS